MTPIIMVTNMNEMICENCEYYESDIKYCRKASTYKYSTPATPAWCPLSDESEENSNDSEN